MLKSRKFSDRVSETLFSNGCFFFLPYFVVYFIWLRFGLGVRSIEIIFSLLHVFNLAFLLNYFQRIASDVRRPYILFWGSLFLFFAGFGAYLEFPSDPWEHVWRIFTWARVGKVADHPTAQRFAYFWGWTLLGGLPLSIRRLGIDLYSAFWQWILYLQFYFLLVRLGFRKSLALVQALSAVVLFGTNLFSFRYYALSSTPLAYTLYLRSLIVLIDAFEGSPKNLAWLPLLALAIYFNHPQELFFLLLMGLGICIFFGLRWARRFRSHFPLGLMIGAFAVITVTAWLAPEMFLHLMQRFTPKVLNLSDWRAANSNLHQLTPLKIFGPIRAISRLTGYPALPLSVWACCFGGAILFFAGSLSCRP